jgi:hypothetical protein
VPYGHRQCEENQLDWEKNERELQTLRKRETKIPKREQ